MNNINFPGNKKFGILFSIFFLILSIFFFLTDNKDLLLIFILLFILVSSITIFRPGLLSYPTTLWFHFGKLIGLIISPVVLGIIFIFIILPVAIFFRLIKRDELKLRKNKYITAWINRKNKIFDEQSLKDQF